jgi:hypothetical protein
VISHAAEPRTQVGGAREALERSGVVRVLVLGISVAATVLFIVTVKHIAAKVGLVAVSGGTCAALVVLENRSPRLGVRTVATAIGLILAVAVVTPSRSSNDLWSYVMYGRMVTVHHADPYTAVPAPFPADPYSKLVSPRWSHQSSVYGPAFTAMAAVDVAIAGDSGLASRLVFQGTAAAAMAGICILIWRRTRSPVALLWIALNPVSAIVVNGGHNDALVGLLLLGAAALLSSSRARSAGALIGLAALLKVTALLAVIGACCWLWRAGRRRSAVALSTSALTVTVVGYLPVLESAWRVLSQANRTVTDASAWNPLGQLMLGRQAWRDVPNPLAPNPTLAAISTGSAILVLLLVVHLSWRTAKSMHPEPPIGMAVASYTMAAAYTFPWYAIWALPLFASRKPSRVAWVVWIQSLVLLAALKLPVHPTASVPEAMERIVLTIFAPVALVVAFVIAAIRSGRVPNAVPSRVA